MKLTAKVNKRKWVEHYINIWNGGLNLTDKEKGVLQEILAVYLEYEGKLEEPLLSEIVFSTKMMTKIREKLGLSHQNFHNYKSQLKNKGAVKETPSGPQVNPMLIPKKTVTFNFLVDED